MAVTLTYWGFKITLFELSHVLSLWPLKRSGSTDGSSSWFCHQGSDWNQKDAGARLTECSVGTEGEKVEQQLPIKHLSWDVYRKEAPSCDPSARKTDLLELRSTTGFITGQKIHEQPVDSQKQTVESQTRLKHTWKCCSRPHLPQRQIKDEPLFPTNRQEASSFPLPA